MASCALPVPVQSAVYLCGAVSSSLDVARTLTPDEFPEWGSIIVREQHGGRGQGGRAWVSPPGNLYVTVRLPLAEPFTGLSASPIFGGLCVSALRSFGFSAFMKWPNDILIASGSMSGSRAGNNESISAGSTATAGSTLRKVGGLLLEQRQNVLLAGLGLNLAFAPADSAMRTDRAFPAGCLPEILWKPLCHGLGVVGFWLTLLCRLREQLVRCNMECDGVPAEQACLALAEDALALKHTRVTLVDGHNDANRHTGLLIGLDALGGLCLEEDGLVNSFYSGSLWPAEAAPALR